MKNKVLVLACGLALLLAAGACKKKEEQPPVPKMVMPGQQHGMPGQQQSVPPGPQVMMPKGQTTVIVPDSVKGKWTGVVIIVADKAAKKLQEFKVNLHNDFKIPDSNLRVSVSDFLPDFKMDGLMITSISNETKNPAVGVVVYENDKEIFKGWLYSNFPQIHPFEHPKFSIQLKNGIKKG